MVSRAQRFWNIHARWVERPALVLVGSHRLARKMFTLNAILTAKTPKGLRVEPRSLGGVPAWDCTIAGTATRGTLLYLHGGGFVIGSLRGYRHLVAALGKATGQRAVFLGYRLAPDAPFPAACDDALTAYRALVADPAAGPVTLVGDSAGGNLVFSLLHRIGAEGLPWPAAAVALSPITDLRQQNPSLTANAATDNLVSPRWGARGVAAYLQGQDPSDPRASPILGDYTGAPPVLIQVDRSEILLDDSVLMAAHLRAQGVTVTLTETTGLTHVWHLNAGRSPEADASIRDIGAFLRART